MAEHETAAAIIAATLTAHDRTAKEDIEKAIKTYHECYAALQELESNPMTGDEEREWNLRIEEYNKRKRPERQ